MEALCSSGFTIEEGRRISPPSRRRSLTHEPTAFGRATRRASSDPACFPPRNDLIPPLRWRTSRKRRAERVSPSEKPVSSAWELQELL